MSEHTLTNKVKISDVINFTMSSNTWMEANPNNKNMPLGVCISSMAPQLDQHLAKIREESGKYNKRIEDIKNKYAETVEITENSGSPNQIIVKYVYANKALSDRNVEIETERNVFQKLEKELMEEEVEIVPNYVKVRPTETILPKNIEQFMVNFVISPEADKKAIEEIHRIR